MPESRRCYGWEHEEIQPTRSKFGNVPSEPCDDSLDSTQRTIDEMSFVSSIGRKDERE